MVIYGFEVTIPKGLISIRAQREMATKVHSIISEWWHEKILPKHFQASARQRYSHEPRSEKYLETKRRLAAVGKVKKGGYVDLVATGLMRRQLTQFALIRAYPTRFTVNMLGPYYISMRPKIRTKGKQPPFMAGEITSVPFDELKLLADMAAKELAKRIQTYPGVEVIRVAA